MIPDAPPPDPGKVVVVLCTIDEFVIVVAFVTFFVDPAAVDHKQARVITKKK